ncbi:MAG: sensor histidine kinase [Magnetococcales bacterium]|nr:sensor histidine kinase [Magnetococcales bacterium]
MKSVASQLRVGLSALLFAIFLILFAVHDRLLHGLADAMSWREIARQADHMRMLLVSGMHGDRLPDNPCLEQPGSGLYCQWEWRAAQSEVRRFLSPSLGGESLLLPKLVQGGRMEWKRQEPGGGEMWVVVISSVLPRGELIVAVGQAHALHKSVLRSWRFINLLFASLLLLMIAALVWWYINQAFECFSQLHQELARWQEGGGSRRLPEGPAETQPMMALIERQMHAEERYGRKVRRTLSHVGHTLRIPVTVLLHLAASPKLRELPAIQEVLTEQTGLMERLIERHLRRAALMGRSAAGEWFCLGEELPAMVRALDLMYFDKELEIVMQVPEALRCPGNRDDFLELIGTLADNACKWARSRVLLSAGNEGGFWLTIEDDGPGVDENQLAILRQWSGKRLDESRIGTGMGLIIARDIVTFYEGEITLGRSSELGGFLVSVHLA